MQVGTLYYNTARTTHPHKCGCHYQAGNRKDRCSGSRQSGPGSRGSSRRVPAHVRLLVEERGISNGEGDVEDKGRVR